MFEAAFCISAPTRFIGSVASSRLGHSCKSVAPPSKRLQWRGCSSVSREDVMKTAQLARLEVKEEQVEQVTEEFQKIVDFFNSMKEMDVEGVEPMARPHQAENVVREDIPVRFDDV